MLAQVATCHDPFRPAQHHSVRQVRKRRSLKHLAPKNGRPIICALNGKWQPRAAWGRRVRDGDVVVFVQLPQGGGGDSNPLAIVLQIALFAFSGGIAGAIYEAIGGASLGIGTLGLEMIKAGVGIIGGMLINAIAPPPKPPAAQQMQTMAAPSPTYNLTAQGNQARLGQPIPCVYGRHVIFPDFAAAPYVEYAANEQYLYQLHCIGQGEYDVESIRIEDTPISSFEEIEYQIVPPGGNVTLFPTRVISSVEVSGQEALTNTTLGPFVANSAGTQANNLAIDVVLPRGLYMANDSGGLNTVSASWRIEAQLIDDLGAAQGTWQIIGNESYSAATTTPQRMTYRYAMPSGRYQVRLTRTDTKQTDSRYGHEVAWAGLRAYLPGIQTYGNVTMLALRMRASNNLSNQASRKINVIATRKLQTWHPTIGWSTNAVATRSIAWALADICRAQYGARLADARIDLQALYDLSTVWQSRGDTFDAIFDNHSTVMEALTQVARAGRGIPYMQSGIVHVVRDAAATLPVQMFSQRNIVRGSLRIDYIMHNEDTADAVDVTYFDSTIWSERTVRAALPGSSATQPAQVKLFGVTSRQQAWNEGMYLAACNRYRRRIVTFSTEMEGFIPSLGDLIAIQHDMPKWGQSGEVVAWDGTNKIATLSEPLDWSAGGTHYVSLRKRDGSAVGPYTATAGVDAYHVVLTNWVSGTDPVPDTTGDRERTHFAFGPANAQYIRARVISMMPRSSTQAELNAVIESDYVHTADTGTAPGVNAWQLPSVFTSPVVAGLSARSMPDAPERMVLSWQPAAGADHYLIEQSNGDDTWTRVGETAAANFTAIAIYGPQTIVRVAAVGVTRGPWVEVQYGQLASYFWTDDSNLMWTNDSNLMWRY